MINVNEYVIKYDVRLKGWIAFRITKTGGVRDSRNKFHKLEVVDRIAVTTPKPRAHLAAQALTRVLFLENKRANDL